ncbi:histidinol dehydrogenase, partial [PVC group bacterium]|nr:histidinol dehydrogenase [PVC group bacterium]
FLKKSSFISYSKKNPQALKDAASMAELEGLEAHVRSSKIRL